MLLIALDYKPINLCIDTDCSIQWFDVNVAGSINFN